MEAMKLYLLKRINEEEINDDFEMEENLTETNIIDELI
jgi:hypothetical protein